LGEPSASEAVGSLKQSLVLQDFFLLYLQPGGKSVTSCHEKKMRKVLKHLLWVLPLILLIAAVAMAAYTESVRRTDDAYHRTLPKSLQFTSNSFEDGQEMPAELSCRGTGGSPHIRWRGVEGARSYVLIVMDWDAPSPKLRLFSVVHWILYNIPAGVTEILAKVTPAELQEHNVAVGLNVTGVPEYAPPCPPFGQHRYVFRIYALDVERIEPVADSRADVMRAMDGHIVAYGELVGLQSAG
jgi:Raf kinase inhibitor-like YbhB/YbcL family protein